MQPTGNSPPPEPEIGLTNAEVETRRAASGYNEVAAEKAHPVIGFVRPSRKPETWNIGGFIAVSAVLGVAMVAEALLGLRIAWSWFGLSTHENALHTFSFLLLLYFAAFSVLSARERRWFWATMPSKTLAAALVADALVGTGLTFVGLPGLAPLPGWQALAIFGFAMVSCLLVNDTLKVVLIKWRLRAGA